MGVFQFIQNHHIIKFYVQVLVDGLEGSTDRDIIFQLNGDGLLSQGLEEAVGERRDKDVS